MKFKFYTRIEKIKKKKIINTKDKRNNSYINSLAWVLLISVLLQFVNTILRHRFHLISTSQITLFIYSIILMLNIFKAIKYKSFKVRGVIIYFLIIMFFAINYIIFENSRNYLLSKNMFLIYLFYIPLSILLVGSIKNWNGALKIFQYAYI